MQKKYDVTALGEILIDFTAAGKNADGKNIYEENPGGAPANCAAAVAKLGGFRASLAKPSCSVWSTGINSIPDSVSVKISFRRSCCF